MALVCCIYIVTHICAYVSICVTIITFLRGRKYEVEQIKVQEKWGQAKGVREM